MWTLQGTFFSPSHFEAVFFPPVDSNSVQRVKDLLQFLLVPAASPQDTWHHPRSSSLHQNQTSSGRFA